MVAARLANMPWGRSEMKGSKGSSDPLLLSRSRRGRDERQQNTPVERIIVTERGRIEGKAAVVYSRDVARVFGKEHRNVLRDIDKLIRTNANLRSLNWFRPIDYEDVKGEDRPSFDLTRDGFMWVRDELISLTELWKAAGEDENRRPIDWARKEGATFISSRVIEEKVPVGHLLVTERGRNGGTSSALADLDGLCTIFVARVCGPLQRDRARSL
jgi:Rha family phage regulatory protein